jgi:hypothetical protein
MIQVKYHVKYEERFHIAYKEWISRLRLQGNTPLLEDLKNVTHDISDEKDRSNINLVANINTYSIKHFIDWLQDIEVIMEIPFEIRFITTMAEAYDAGIGYTNPWFVFKR